MKKLSLAIATMVLAGLVLVACNPQALEETAVPEGPETVKIGSMGPMSGDIAWLGEGITNGVKMGAADESNETWKFEVVIEDDQCDPKQAINAYNKLKGQGVTLFAGPECSAALGAVAPLAEKDQIIIMSPSATRADIAKAGDYIFRTPPSDSFQGKVAASLMYNDLGFKKVAINAKNDAWGQGLVEVFTAEFIALGGEVTASEMHEPNATDLKTQLTKIKNSGAEALYAPTFGPEFMVMTKQMKELGMGSLTIVGGDAVKGDEVATAVQDYAGIILVLAGKDNTDEQGMKFLSAYKAAYEKDPSAYAADGYDATRLLAQAVKAVGTDTTEIKTYLYSVEGYPGASGIVTFDANGESIAKEVGVFKFESGKVVPYTE